MKNECLAERFDFKCKSADILAAEIIKFCEDPLVHMTFANINPVFRTAKKAKMLWQPHSRQNVLCVYGLLDNTS